MKEIWLVRHGQASWNKPDYDQLSQLGHEQCVLLGRLLRSTGAIPDRVVIGGLRRHRQSWDAIVAGGGFEIMKAVDRDWNEYDHTDVLGGTYPEFAEHASLLAHALLQADPAATFQHLHDTAALAWTRSRSGHGYRESFDAFGARVLGAFQRVVADDAAERSLIVTSGGPISAVVSALVAGNDSLWVGALETTRNSSITRIAVGSSGSRLISYNEHSHLTVALSTSV